MVFASRGRHRRCTRSTGRDDCRNRGRRPCGPRTDHEALTGLRTELERIRTETRAERDALRADHAEQLAQAQRSAYQPQALAEALAAARDTAAAYRSQLTAKPQTRPNSSTYPKEDRIPGRMDADAGPVHPPFFIYL